MNKATAIELLGGTVKAAADACQISSSAVSQWPDELTKDQVDRVQAALYRMQSADAGRQPAPKRKLAKEVSHG